MLKAFVTAEVGVGLISLITVFRDCDCLIHFDLLSPRGLHDKRERRMWTMEWKWTLTSFLHKYRRRYTRRTRSTLLDLFFFVLSSFEPSSSSSPPQERVVSDIHRSRVWSIPKHTSHTSDKALHFDSYIPSHSAWTWGIAWRIQRNLHNRCGASLPSIVLASISGAETAIDHGSGLIFPLSLGIFIRAAFVCVIVLTATNKLIGVLICLY